MVVQISCKLPVVCYRTGGAIESVDPRFVVEQGDIKASYPGCYGKILCTGAASCNSLVDAGTAREIEHIVVEGERSTFVVSLNHEACEFFVLSENNRQVFLCDCRRAGGICNDRLHGELVESEIQHLLNIIYEINRRNTAGR